VGAKQGFEQSLAAWQKLGDKMGISFALLGWRTAAQEADFPGARKMMSRRRHMDRDNDKIDIAETRSGSRFVTGRGAFSR